MQRLGNNQMRERSGYNARVNNAKEAAPAAARLLLFCSLELADSRNAEHKCDTGHA